MKFREMLNEGKQWREKEFDDKRGRYSVYYPLNDSDSIVVEFAQPLNEYTVKLRDAYEDYTKVTTIKGVDDIHNETEKEIIKLIKKIDSKASEKFDIYIFSDFLD
jgi:hypothetical protein